ncbi:MAG: substrate-binding domain-containing protein [Lentisphaerota bacterium]
MNVLQENIYKYLLDSISAGKLCKDDRIPTENELGEMFNTNRMNAHFAIKELERSGVLRRNKGQGTFVRHVPRIYSLGKLKSVATRRICVLNLCYSRSSQVHWNNRIINALEETLRESDIEIAYNDVSGFQTLEEYKELLETLLLEGCNGLIIIDNGENDFLIDHMEIFFKFHNNVYIFDRGFKQWQDMPYNVVSMNIFGEGLIAAEYLLMKGYVDVIFCKNCEDEHWLRERIRGMQFGFNRGQCKKEMVICEVSENGINCDLMQKIKAAPGKYTLAVQNDFLAARIIDYCSSAGLKVGKDFRTISFDDSAELRNYDLTTVSPALERIGKYLAAIVKKNVDKNDCKEILCVKINSELVVRSSC